MVQISNMIDDDEKAGLSFKAIITGAVISSACVFITYNVLFSQDTMANRPGSTAVRVEVKDMDISPNPTRKVSSIGQLVDQTGSGSSYGQTNALTSSIQGELVKLGFYQGVVDGKHGPQTQTAIIAYQRRVELQPTGKVSQALLDHILLTRKISESADVTGSVRPDAHTNNSVATSLTSSSAPSAPIANIQVLQVQEKLALFGYNPGKADGLIGASTANAIKQFEKDRSMTVTGRISTALKSQLGL